MLLAAAEAPQEYPAVQSIGSGSRDTEGQRQGPAQVRQRWGNDEGDDVPDVKEGMKVKRNVKEKCGGTEERRRVGRRLDGRDSKDAESQLRTRR